MSVAKRGDDPRRLLFEVYDDHQPPTWAHVLPEETLSVRPFVRLAMVGGADRRKYGVDVRLELGVTTSGNDVLRPGVLEKDHANTFGGVVVSPMTFRPSAAVSRGPCRTEVRSLSRRNHRRSPFI